MVNIQKLYSKFAFFNLLNSKNLNNWLVLIFFILSLIGILNHEMWRDELQAWLIAKDSSSLTDLYHNLRYEGHPGLWHIFLYVITRFTHNPVAMQFFHLIIGTAVIYIFTKFSPFTATQKVLFAFSYFPFYEYNIISRSYNLGLLFLFLFCTLFTHGHKNYLFLALFIFFLANTNVYSLIIAISLTMTLTLDFLLNKKQISSVSKNVFWISLIICIIGIIISIYQIIPPESGFQGNGILVSKQSDIFTFIKELRDTILTIFISYVPIPNFNYHFWNSNILVDSSDKILKFFGIFLSLFLFFFSTYLFVKKPIPFFLYLSGTLGILLFTFLKFFGSIRHHGHLFILLLVCLWISYYYPSQSWQIRYKSLTINFNLTILIKNFLNILLCFHVLAGLYAYSMDLKHPFSASKQVANFLENQQLTNKVIVGSKDYAVSPISALINRKIYYPESNNFGSFINWNNRKTVASKEVLNAIKNILPSNQTQVLLILSYQLDIQTPDLKISKISEFKHSLVSDEIYYLYLIEQKNLTTWKKN